MKNCHRLVLNEPKHAHCKHNQEYMSQYETSPVDTNISKIKKWIKMFQRGVKN